jgi:hypothetical protein
MRFAYCALRPLPNPTRCAETVVAFPAAAYVPQSGRFTMNKFTVLSAGLAAMLAALLPAAPAQAQNVTSFVSATANPGTACTFADPCNSFQAAHDKTNSGGEIKCLTSGLFGGMTASKSITIDCAGVSATMTTLGVDAASIVVRIRNVSLGGIGFFQGAALLVENCVVANRSGASGIFFRPPAPAQLFVTDTTISNNGSSGIQAGITIEPASGVLAKVTIERSQIENNLFGIVANGSPGGTIRGVVSDSVVSGNTNNGITVSASGTNVVLAVDNTTVANNNFGLVASGTNAGMLVRRSFITSNTTGLFTSGAGALYSYGDNSVNNNPTSDGAFTAVIGLK